MTTSPHHLSGYTAGVRVIIGLGGNLGDPPRSFAAALTALALEYRVLSRSSLYRSDPVGPPQPRYWNAAAVIESGGPLLALLARCKTLEDVAGRRRGGVRWSPRPLDLDLLMADGAVHRGPRLHVPHPRLRERAFAAVPGAEVAPEWVHPHVGVSLAELARSLPSAGLERLAERW